MSVEAKSEIKQPKALYEFKFFSLYGKDYGIRISDRYYAVENARLKAATQAFGGGMIFFGSIYSGSGVGRNSVKVVGAAYKGRKYFTIALNKTDDIVKDIGKVVSKVETKVDDVIKGSSKAGTLSNLETRQWYLQQEAKIPELINKNASLEEQARQAFDLRNQFRTQARELMSDRDLAASLNKTDPNLTWEQVVQKYTEKGFQGDDLYREIVNSAQRSRTSVNKSLGIE